MKLQNDEKKKFKIKLPSNPGIVTPDTLWKVLKTISKTGDTFTKDNLISCGLYTKVDDHIRRNLAYLKYLGIIEESRGKVDGKNLQKFNVQSNEEVKGVVYEIKASREDEAKNKWGNLLKNHELYKAIKNNFFKGEKIKTLIDLEHFLRFENPDKSPAYYQNGGNFIVKLLSETGLITKKENNIEINEYDALPPTHENNESQVETTDKITDDPNLRGVDTDIEKQHVAVITGPVYCNIKITLESKSQITIIKSILDDIEKNLEK